MKKTLEFYSARWTTRDCLLVTYRIKTIFEGITNRKEDHTLSASEFKRKHGYLPADRPKPPKPKK